VLRAASAVNAIPEKVGPSPSCRSRRSRRARSECQGQGLGSALVEVGTSRADAAGVPCYLETGTQSNIDFYTKRGFEIVGQTDFDGHTLTGMVRQPREQSAP